MEQFCNVSAHKAKGYRNPCYVPQWLEHWKPYLGEEFVVLDEAENDNDHHVMTDLGITIVVPNICLSHSKVDGESIDPNNC